MNTLKQPHKYTGYLFWVSIILIVGTFVYVIIYSSGKKKHYYQK